MNGSWAGAMGHMQFMPSTFRAYAVDADGDGRIDCGSRCPTPCIGGQLPQARGLAPDEPVALEVRLPDGFDCASARDAPSAGRRGRCRGADDGGHALPERRGRGGSAPQAGRGRPSWCSTTRCGDGLEPLGEVRDGVAQLASSCRRRRGGR